MCALKCIRLCSQIPPCALIQITLLPLLYFHPLVLIVTVSHAFTNQTGIISLTRMLYFDSGVLFMLVLSLTEPVTSSCTSSWLD
jgi:hypothetical protein